jgi:hypothetical protein
MNLDNDKIAKVIERIVKEAIADPIYPFGIAGKKGISNKIASKTMYNSVQVNAVKDKDMMAFQIMMVDYYEYVQAGRKGGKYKKFKRKESTGGTHIDSPFIKSLIQWIKDRRLNVKDYRSAAYGIRTNIFKFGIKPADISYAVINKLTEDLELAELIGEMGYSELINSLQGL